MKNAPTTVQVDDLPDFVWYTSYGSNLNKERFLCYIQGGRFRKAITHSPGCVDRTLPKDIQAVTIPFKMYFSSWSPGWNGGVCFIDPETPGKTLGRAYLITREQFWQVVAQESSLMASKLDITPADLPTNATALSGTGAYDRLVLCGTLDGWPLLSFTAPVRHAEPTTPTPAYLQTMGEGLAEVHGMSAKAIAEYLAPLDGVKGTYSTQDLVDLLEEYLEPAARTVDA